MEQVISFIMSNFYLVFIAIALLGLLRKRAAGKTGEKSDPRSGMPTFGGKQMDRQRGMEQEPAERSRLEQAADALRTSSVPNMTEREGYETSEEGRSMEWEERASISQTSNEESDHSFYWNEDAKKAAAALELKRENVIQGIMWSEILGPPRAKRAYRSPRN